MACSVESASIVLDKLRIVEPVLQSSILEAEKLDYAVGCLALHFPNNWVIEILGN